MFGLVMKIFLLLLSNIVNGCNHTKCISLSNQKGIIQPAVINLQSNECSQDLYYYSFAVKLDRCVGSCNSLNDLSNKACVPNKTEDLNLSMFSMITEINESKTITKHVSWECKCKIDGRNCGSDQWWYNGKFWCGCKKLHACEKNYIGNPTTCICKNGKYLASIVDDSASTCDETIEEEMKTVTINFNEKMQSGKEKILYSTHSSINYHCIIYSC